MERAERILKELGFKDNEIKIYLISLSLGEQPSSVLGSRSGISRTNTNYICNKLVEKGVLNMIESKNGNLYTPENPEKLLTILNKQYDRIDLQMDKVRSILPDLSGLIGDGITESKVKYFRGTEGIIDMFEDMLQEGKTIYGALDFGGGIPDDIVDYMENNYVPRRIKKGITTYGILNPYEDIGNYIVDDTARKSNMIFINNENFPFSSDLNIYGNKVSFFSFKEKTGVIINSSFIKDTIFSLFQLSWNYVKTLEGNEKHKNTEL